MDYIDIVDVEMNARKYIIDNYSNITVVSPHRFFSPLEMIINIGYTEWSRYNITVLPLDDESIYQGDIIVYESNSFVSDKILQSFKNMTRVRKFEKNRVFISIYEP
jgi:hypothetical protein